ncbi:carbohydrate ABC transporter permease [Paenibacillus aceris]|uniref:Raffinose/stachyose/melibiose transport system permease protein n=1 Tax=Paenibacillus aceris TaxID=869555 RepID=A0ABS4I3W1_9BACL|nr:sugar ABC transporter permease [Paenibacillus aceris]MBP1965498.1 raffinose/stachyose/melibiose transport system permease protein [Paenibacillus aceris]NHW33453.1 sugar ABC transporter permease [Paenibacillus aceris]
MGYRVMKPWLFLLPALIIYLTVIFVPSLYTLFLSFFSWNGVAPHKDFVGLDNYIDLFTKDTVFPRALKNNLQWMFGSLVITLSFGLSLALLLNKKIKGRTFFRAIFYFPYVLSGVVVATVWAWIYNPTQGFINRVLEAIGLESWTHAWLAEPKIALYAVFIAALWQGVGQPMVLFLAGLSTISQEPYEAAIIDGAKPYQSFFYITIPMLQETFVIVIATTMIAAMKVYDIIYAMTGGGPAESTQVLSSWMYYQTFKFANIGIGSAISWFLVFVVMIVIIPYVYYTTKKSHL